MTEPLFNPFEPGFTDDPYPAYRRLRETAPVYDSQFGVWILSRYQDVSAILRAPLSVNSDNIAGGIFREQYDQLDRGVRPLSMLDRDPPDHTRLRSLVAKVFTPRAIAALEPRVTELVDEALDRMEDEGQADVVAALAFPLPFQVISAMLGMPPTDQVRVRELSGLVVRSLEVIVDADLLAAIGRAGRELHEIIGEVIAWKREHPADDLLTALIAAEDAGDKLTDDELIAQVELLFIAGHETTVNLIASGTVALLRNPAQLALLRDNPALAANATEELLRYDSPVQQSRRITLAPYTAGGREIPAGTFVVAALASANRDEAFWGPSASALRIDRENARQHVSFGAGPHHCLGASLARLEGRIAIGRLVQRFGRLAFDGDVEWNGRMNLRGPARVPVRVSR